MKTMRESFGDLGSVVLATVAVAVFLAVALTCHFLTICFAVGKSRAK
jgi:hypothetical protein